MDNRPQNGTYKFDLIHDLTENGLRHTSGPVHTQTSNPLHIYAEFGKNLFLVKKRQSKGKELEHQATLQ